MKKLLVSVLGCVALQVGLADRATAQAPVYPYDTAAPIAPGAPSDDDGDGADDDADDVDEAARPQPPATQPAPAIAPAPAFAPQPAQQIPAAPPSSGYVAPPQGYYPPPPQGYYPPPQGYYPPPPQGYYPPPQGYSPSMQYPLPPGYHPPGYMPPPQAPPPSRRMRHHRSPHVRPRGGACVGGSCAPPAAPVVVGKLARPAKPEGRARYFSIGARASVLGMSQQIGDKRVVLGGGGVEMRLRTKGRFGIELSLDVLRAEFALNGPITRTSIPLQLNLMVYIFPNTDDRVFNMYFLAGGGFSRTNMTLIDPSWNEVQQTFYEWTAQGGLGLELRFRWFALRADVRAIGMFRDNRMLPTQNYLEVDGAPVPNRSMGGQGTLGAAFWF